MKKHFHFWLLACMLTWVLPVQASDSITISNIMKQRLNRAAMVPDSLQNPGFEHDGAVAGLFGWTAVVHAGNSYRIEQDRSQIFSGQRSLVIENTGKPQWGGVVQVFRAENLAGREIELSAQLKMQGVTAPGFHMMLKITQMGREIKIAKTHDQFIGDADWKVVSLRTMLPKETTHIEVALTLEGDGRVWIDDVGVGPLAEKN